MVRLRAAHRIIPTRRGQRCDGDPRRHYLGGQAEIRLNLGMARWKLFRQRSVGTRAGDRRSAMAVSGLVAC